MDGSATSRARRRLPACILALALTAGACGIATPAHAGDKVAEVKAAKPGSYYAKGVPVCPQPKPGRATCMAMRRVLVKTKTKDTQPLTVEPAPAPGPAGGLTPASLAGAYGFARTTGVGQTVAIVDAYNDPNAEADLATFSSQYGLPACTTANGCFKKVGQTGSTTALPPNDTTGWSVEVSLDVQAVHGVCPNCKILLVETNDNSFVNLAAGVNEANALGAQEISNSYGGSESGMPATQQAAYNHPGRVITASTGDFGWYDWDNMNRGFLPPSQPDVPATLNSVVAVGGTTLRLTQAGTRASEEVWDNDGPMNRYGLVGATGGGCSKLFSARAWQPKLANWAATTCGTKRLAADISAVADPLTGFDIFHSYNCGSACSLGWNTFGGTSLSAPVVAALYALAGGPAGVSYPSLTPYGHLADTTPSLYDVTVGGNGWCGGLSAAQCGTVNPNARFGAMVDCAYTDTSSPGTPSAGTAQCDAAPGYDGPTGVGTPTGLKSLQPVQFAVITLPTSLPLNTAATFSASKSKDPYPGGTISSYTWNWGDGTANSTGVAPTHAYTTAGTYKITLTVVGAFGERSTATASVTLGAKPTAVITAPATITHGTAATFSGASSTDKNTGGKITSYTWTWGDGTAATTTSTATTTHTYATAGSKTVTLTVKDNYGNTSLAASKTVTVG